MKNELKKKIAEGFVGLICHDYETHKEIVNSIINNKNGLNAGLSRAANKMGFPESYVPHIVKSNKVLYLVYIGGRNGHKYISEDGEIYTHNNNLDDIDLEPSDDNHCLNRLGFTTQCNAIEDLLNTVDRLNWAIKKFNGEGFYPTLSSELLYWRGNIKFNRELSYKNLLNIESKKLKKNISTPVSSALTQDDF